METYTLSPAERRARAQALREQRENRYQYKKYFEEKAAIEQQQRQAELDIKNAESQRKGADFFTRTISTLGDVAGNIITGALKGIEGIYDLGAGIVGAVGGMFSDEFSEGVKNHIAYDAVGQWVGNPIAEMTKYSYIYDTSDTFQNITRGVASGVGQILPAVAVSILTAGAGAPAAIASLASSATFIAGAAGRGTEEAFNEGADFYQGLGYGILTGAVEGAIEKLSGGVSKAFMGKGLIDDVIKGATKKITTNAVAQKGLQILIEAGGEGAEEWVSELVNPYLKRMTYNSEAELSTSKSRLEAALIGGLTSLAYSGSIARVGAKSRNVSENLSEINTLKAKEENLWGNGKLDNEKATNIKTSIDNNYLEISKLLVKASEKSRANIIKKFKLESKFNADGTLVNEDVETVASNTQKPNLDIAGGQTNKDRQILETQTTAEIKPLASPVAYNREAYSPALVGKEVDLAFKPTIESLTDAQIKARQDFTKLNKGKVKAKLVFTNDLSVDSDGNIQDGAYKNGILYINTKANAAEVVVKHELSHFAEGTKAYLKYADFVLREINSNEAMTKKFGNLIEKINETSNLYKAVNQGKDISQEQREVLTEVIAQYTSENLFTNEEQINRLARVDRNFFQKVVDWFKDTIGNFQHKKNLSKEEKETVDFLKRAEKLYSKALGEAWGASDHTNYSLGKDKFDANKKKRYNNYNQYDTLAKQWAFSPKTKAGDKKVLFNAKTNEYNLIIATKDDNGFTVAQSIKDTESNIEIIKNIYSEVYNEHRDDQSFYESIDAFRTIARSGRDDLSYAENRNANEQNGGLHRDELQSNGNADIGKSNGTPNGGLKYSLKHNVGKIANANELKAAQLKLYVLRQERNLESRESKNITNSEEYKREYNALFDKKITETTNKDIDSIESKYGIKAKRNAIEELTEKIKAYDIAIEEYHKNLIIERKNSGEDFAESHRKKAVKEYGYTLNFNEAGYILPNGKMLNFSGGEKGQHFGYRGQDHRNIGIVFDEGELGDSASDSLIAFMSEGSIRIMPESPGVDICREPSNEQFTTIRNFVSKFAFENEYFNIDFSNEKGDVVNSIEYEYKVSGTKVVNDIKYYFEKGEVPKQSATAQFRYSLSKNDIIRQDDTSNNYEEYLPSESNKDFKKAVNRFSYPIKLYRGMELAEYESIINSGYIKSKGDYNFSYQQGRTYFAKHPSTSFSYATSFASSEIRDKFFRQGKHSYIIEVINAPELQIDYGEGDDNNWTKFRTDELSSAERIALDYISKIYELTYHAEDDSISAEEIELDDRMNKVEVFDGYKPSLYKDKVTGTILFAIKDKSGENSGLYISSKNTDKIIDYKKDFAENNTLAELFKEYCSVSGNDNDLILFKPNNGKIKYSLKTNKDNLGNELSNKQQEYFMDSKVVDSNGNLHVVYHGTKQEFNVFDINKLGDNTGLFTEGVGFYFTENEDVANSYTRGTNKKHKVYLNITKPMLVNQNKFTKDIRKKIFLELYKIDNNALSNYSDVAYEGINLAVKEALKIESSNETDLDFIASLVNGGVTKSQTILNTVTKITGYDGVINNGITTSAKKDYKVFVAFNPNQIKLTSNQNPTQNEDIRYSLSNGEVKKIVANKTKLKSYTKEDAEVIINGVMSHYMAFGDKYGDLSSKTKRQAITLLWEGLNTADKGYQAGIALDIANYIIENSVMEDIYADNDNTVYIDVIRLLKPYLHKIDLSSLKGEIAHKYDKDKSVYALWGKRKGEKGYGADQVGQELLDFGMQIEATNEADIFFEIDSAYRKAINSLKKQAKTALKDIASAEELKKLKQDIAREILIGYDKQGTETAFGKTIKKYIKQIQLLKGQVKDLKERNKALNNLYESIDKLKGLEKYQKADIELADEVLGLIKLLKKVKTYRGNLSQNVRDIMIAYSKEVDGKKLYDIIANAGNGIDNPVAQLIEDIAHKNGDLSTQELRNLDLIMQNAIHNINNYDKVFFEGKTQEDAQIVEKAIKETKESKKIKDSGVGGSLSKFSRWLTAPIWRFQRLCSYRKNGIMSKVFTEFQNGVSRQAEFNMEVAEHYKEFFKKNKKVASGWSKATFDVDSAKLSRGQAISLYMLSLREQAKGHLFNNKDGSSGTIRITDDTIANKGRFSEALTKGQDVTISQDVIDSIEKSLTLEEREFISLTQEFFNKIAKNAKVDTDMALFGISNAVEDNYIPIRVADDQLYKQIGDEQSAMSFKSLFSVYTPSFNKDVKPNSKNKIVVENIIDIVNRHAKQMSAYYGLAVPVKTFNRLYNKTLDNGEKLSVEIAQMDSEFERYVGKLLSDMQGNVKEKTGFDHALGKIRGWGAKAALGLNLKVLANQFVSLPAAAAIGVKYKSIAKGFTKAVSRKTDFDILVKYCPMLYDRFREGNNIDVGLLKENQGVLGKVDALTNLTTLPIGKIDKFICGAVWNSCLEQTKNSTDYTNYSDEHYKAAAKLTEEAVIKTQANYLALYRPAILREQNSLLQLSTMFMSEPLQQFSLLASALDKIKVANALLKNATGSADIAEAQELLKNSKTEARHAITAVAIDSILLVLIAQAFKWVKGKEDDDKVEGIIGDFTGNFVGMLPFVRDIYSLLQGYDVTNMAYSGLTNITSGVKEMYSIIDLLISGKAYSNSEIMGGLRKTLLGISQTFGIPLRNLETYVKGIVEKFSPSATYKYDNFFYNKTSSNYTKDLQKAMDNGDEKLSDTILDLMLEEEKVGVKDSNTRKIIKDLYEQGFNVLPKSISTTITYDNEKIILTKNQLKQFKAIYEEASDEVKTLTQADKFLVALPEVQAKSIKFVYDYYYNSALEDLLGIDLESKNMLFAKAINISDLAVVVSSIKDFETTIDKHGNTVQGSKKAKVQTYVNSLKLNAAQKYMLMGYCGYSNSKGDIRVKQYIQSLKLTKKQKESLLTMSGYESKRAS